MNNCEKIMIKLNNMRTAKNLKLVLCGLLCIMNIIFIGCDNDTAATDKSPTYLYYVSNDETKIIPVEYTQVEIDEKFEDDKDYYEALCKAWINALSGLPDDLSLKSPIDNGMGVKSVTYLSGLLTLDFDEVYLQKDSISEVLRRAAIVKTLLQIDGVDGIAFTVAGNPITDSTQNPIGVMTGDTFVSNSGAEINSYETTTLQLYFADEMGERLVGTKEKVGYISNISMERLVVDRIVAGPITKKAYPTVDSTLKVLNVTTKDGVCYVNFDTPFLTKTQRVSDEVLLYSFVNSLTELPNISKVQFMVDSESEITFGDHTYLSDPFERNLELIATE